MTTELGSLIRELPGWSWANVEDTVLTVASISSFIVAATVVGSCAAACKTNRMDKSCADDPLLSDVRVDSAETPTEVDVWVKLHVASAEPLVPGQVKRDALESVTVSERDPNEIKLHMSRFARSDRKEIFGRNLEMTIPLQREHTLEVSFLINATNGFRIDDFDWREHVPPCETQR